MNFDSTAVKAYADLRGNPTHSQTIRPEGLMHPCRNRSVSPDRARLNAQTCAILSKQHNLGNPACRELASGTGRHSPDVHQALVAKCSQQ